MQSCLVALLALQAKLQTLSEMLHVPSQHANASPMDMYAVKNLGNGAPVLL